MPRHFTTVTLAALLLPALAVGQKPQRKLNANSFFPQEYTMTAFVDMKAFMDTDLFEQLERNLVARPMFGMMRRQFGFRVTDLDRVRMGGITRKRENSDYPEYLQVVVLQGRKLKLPKKLKDEYDWNRRTADKIGDYDVLQEGIDPTEENSWHKPGLWIKVDEKRLVYGDKRLIQPVLEGKSRGGVPTADLLAFTAGRRPLAYFAGHMPWNEQQMKSMLPFPFRWYTEDDKPQFFMFRLNVDAETQHTTASMHIRFKNGKAGPKLFRESMDKDVAELLKDKRFKFLKPFFAKLKKKIDGTDFVALVEMGSAKDTMQLLTIQQLLPLFYFAAASDQAIAGKAVVVEVAEPDEFEEVKPAKKVKTKEAEKKEAKPKTEKPKKK